MGNKGITEAKTTKSGDYIFEQKISQKIMILEITGEETGYTIQALKGVDYYFSDPAVIVKTYKVNVLIRRLNPKPIKAMVLTNCVLKMNWVVKKSLFMQRKTLIIL